jgi:predicted nucleic acid-binding Zn ribbon protein
MKPKSKNPFIRNEEATKLDSAIDQMFEAYRIKDKADKTTIITLWKELMGNTIASRTTKMFFKGNVLYVELTSAPLKQELTLSKVKILALLNEKVGKGVIEDIIFR